MPSEGTDGGISACLTRSLELWVAAGAATHSSVPAFGNKKAGRKDMNIRSTMVVALFDILGTKARLEKSGIDGILSDYQKLAAFVEKQTGCLCVSAVPVTDGASCLAAGWLTTQNGYFSDTFVLWAEYEAFRMPAFFQMCSDLFCYALTIGLPLRGGIGVGDAYMDKQNNIFLGHALVDAAQAEAAQLWLGISGGLSFNNKQFCGPFDPRTILAYSKQQHPKKSYQLPGIVLDWPRRWRETQTANDLTLVINALNTDPDYEEYYKNTIAFAEFSKQNHDWFLRNANMQA